MCWNCPGREDPEVGGQAGSRDRAVTINIPLDMAAEPVQQERAAAATAGPTAAGQAAH